MDHVSNSVIAALFQLAHIVLDIYVWVVIVAAAMIWLSDFKVIDKDKGGVKGFSDLLGKLTEPFLNPIRRVLKPKGGFDLAPLALLLIVFFLQSFVNHMHMHYYTTDYYYSWGWPG